MILIMGLLIWYNCTTSDVSYILQGFVVTKGQPQLKVPSKSTMINSNIKLEIV